MNTATRFPLCVALAALSACAPQPPTVVNQAQRSARPTATPTPIATPTAAPTAVPTPSLSLFEVLRDGTAAVLRVPAYDADVLRGQAETPEEEAALLASVPEEERRSFLNDYLELNTIVRNVPEVQERIRNPQSCSPRSYMTTDPVTLADISLFKEWGESLSDLDARLAEYGLPSTSERHYITVDCDSRESREAGVREAESLIAESGQRLASEEEAAEAVLAEMLRETIHRALGERMPTQVEFERGPFTQFLFHDMETLEPVGSAYYPFEMDQDELQGVMDRLYYEVFQAHPPYSFGLREVHGFAADSSPATPLVASADRYFAMDGLFGLDLAVRRLIARYPLGSGSGLEGRTIAETFALIAGRELSRDLVETNYPALAAGDTFHRTMIQTRFDSEGRHINLPCITSPHDPFQVYGQNELAHALFELRNCGIDRGQALGEFFEMMKGVDVAQEVYSAFQRCQAQH